MANEKAIYGFGLSVAVSSVFTALLVVVKEMHEPLKSWMKAAMGHHWITHGVLTVLVFVLLGFVLTRLGTGTNASRLAFLLATGIVLSGAIIFGYFLMHL